LLAANLRVEPDSPKTTTKTSSAKSSAPCPLFFDDQLLSKLLPKLRDCDPKQPSVENQANAGYTIVKVADAQGTIRKVLIIGLVDGGNALDPKADFLREIPIDKKSFYYPECPPEQKPADCKKYKMVITRPADELLRILYQTRDQTKDQAEEDQKIAFRLVLAQMPRASAMELATLFGRRSHTCVQVGNDDNAVTPLAFDFTRVDPTRGYSCRRDPDDEKKGLRYKAEVLPPINLVISEAQDGRSTEFETVQYDQDPDRNYTRAYLATPHSGYDNNLKQIMLPRSILTATVPLAPATALPKTQVASFHNTGQWYESTEGKPGPGKPDEKYYCDPTLDPNQPEFSAFCILRTLQAVTGSDVAMLQSRDIFPPDALLEADRKEIQKVCDTPNGKNQAEHEKNQKDCRNLVRLEQMLWKDDTPTIVDLSGKQLKAVLTASKDLYANDQRTENRDADGEWVYTFGVVTPKASGSASGGRNYQSEFNPAPLLCNDDPGQAKAAASGAAGDSGGGASASVYCVNGLPLDDARIYHVATSAALVNNDLIFSGA
jgi:hypothetical protein